MTSRTINYALRRLRMREFLIVEKTAAKIGVSATTYTRWEQGYQSPSPLSLMRLCKTFNATPEEVGFGYIR